MKNNESSSSEPPPKFFKSMLYIMICSPWLYLLILALLEYMMTDQIFNGFFTVIPFNFRIIELLFGLLSFFDVIFIDKIIIPKLERDVKTKYLSSLLVISYGSTIIGVFGLLIGLLELFFIDIIDWLVVIMFFTFSLFYGFYLLFKFVNPSLQIEK